MINADFLIIGSGIAGLSFALKVAQSFPDNKIIIVTKSDALEGNTKYAQGGIAAVLNVRSIGLQKHIQDTLSAGDFLNNSRIVNIVVGEAAERLMKLSTGV